LVGGLEGGSVGSGPPPPPPPPPLEGGAGVSTGPGVDVGRGVKVAVAGGAGIYNNWPMLRTELRVRQLAANMRSTVILAATANCEMESPDCTR
jgi:hypothetical protein